MFGVDDDGSFVSTFFSALPSGDFAEVSLNILSIICLDVLGLGSGIAFLDREVEHM